jgi:hypothetical protein
MGSERRDAGANKAQSKAAETVQRLGHRLLAFAHVPAGNVAGDDVGARIIAFDAADKLGFDHRVVPSRGYIGRTA